VEEFFREGQAGSSSMLHKCNPVSSENISGCARVLRGYITPSYEDIPLWHERDISHSSVERIILPDATILLDYMLNRFSGVIKNLTVFPENMKENIYKTYGLTFSQRVLHKLIDKGLSREDAYAVVQPLAMQAWKEKTMFRDLVEDNETVQENLTSAEIDDAFDLDFHTRNIDTIFERVGLK
jgi:adenylosuccinate lyase